MSSNEPIAADGHKTASYLACRQPRRRDRRLGARPRSVAVVLSSQEACKRYMLSLEELTAWEAALDQNRVPGLRVTRLQMYRREPLRKKP